jgi:hypothetical protein
MTRSRFSAGAAAIRWSRSIVDGALAMEGERDDRTQTVGSIFVKIAPAVVEIWVSASAARGGEYFSE